MPARWDTQILHVQVRRFKYPLPLPVSSGSHRLLEQLKRLVPAPVFERNLTQGEIDLVQELSVLFVVQHVFKSSTTASLLPFRRRVMACWMLP